MEDNTEGLTDAQYWYTREATLKDELELLELQVRGRDAKPNNLQQEVSLTDPA